MVFLRYLQPGKHILLNYQSTNIVKPIVRLAGVTCNNGQDMLQRPGPNIQRSAFYTIQRNFSLHGRLLQTEKSFTNDTESPVTSEEESAKSPPKRSLFQGALKLLRGNKDYSKYALECSAMNMYLFMIKQVDHDFFMKELDLPDTFNGWFKVTELHVWMLLLRLAQEGKEGKVMGKKLVEAMWFDSEHRIEKLGHMKKRYMKEGLKTIFSQFKTAILLYDEGILGDDETLANALWICMYNQKCEDPQKIEKLVEYVRRQVLYLSMNDSKLIFEKGIVLLLPLYENSPDEKKAIDLMKEIGII